MVVDFDGCQQQQLVHIGYCIYDSHVKAMLCLLFWWLSVGGQWSIIHNTNHLSWIVVKLNIVDGYPQKNKQGTKDLKCTSKSQLKTVLNMGTKILEFSLANFNKSQQVMLVQVYSHFFDTYNGSLIYNDFDQHRLHIEAQIKTIDKSTH